MRHLKAGKRLGVTTSHRKALMRNLVTSLLEHGEIKTTVTKAKEMRKYFDKMIGLGKKNNLHARRQALGFVKSKAAIEKLFEEYGPLYEDRNGGYTRIYRIGNRLGDNAEMALIQMVGLSDKESKKEKVKAEKATIEEVKEELKAEVEDSGEGVVAEVIEEPQQDEPAEKEKVVETAEKTEETVETAEEGEKQDKEPVESNVATEEKE